MYSRSSSSDSNRLSDQLPVHVPGNAPLSPILLDASPVGRQSNDTASAFTLSRPAPHVTGPRPPWTTNLEQHRIGFLAYHFTHPDNTSNRNRNAYNKANAVALNAEQCREWLVDEELRRRSEGFRKPTVSTIDRYGETDIDPELAAVDRAFAKAQAEVEGKRKAEQLTQTRTSACVAPSKPSKASKALMVGTWQPKVAPQEQEVSRREFLRYHGSRPLRVLPTSIAEFNATHGTRLESKLASVWVTESRKNRAAELQLRPLKPQAQSHPRGPQPHAPTFARPGEVSRISAPVVPKTVPATVTASEATTRTPIRFCGTLPDILLEPGEQIPDPGLPAEAYRNVLVETFRVWDRTLKEVTDAINRFYQTDISERDARRWVARDHVLANKMIPRVTRFFEDYGVMTSVQARGHECFPPGQVSESALRTARMEARRLIDARADALEMPMQAQKARTVSTARSSPTDTANESDLGLDLDFEGLATEMGAEMGTDLMSAMSEEAVLYTGLDPARTAEDFADVWAWMNTDATTAPTQAPRSPNSLLASSGPIDDFDWSFI
ncbi:hypothetical protein BH09PSE5_BH09PSE5_13050 [soil metagenome]